MEVGFNRLVYRMTPSFSTQFQSPVSLFFQALHETFLLFLYFRNYAETNTCYSGIPTALHDDRHLETDAVSLKGFS